MRPQPIITVRTICIGGNPIQWEMVRLLMMPAWAQIQKIGIGDERLQTPIPDPQFPIPINYCPAMAPAIVPLIKYWRAKMKIRNDGIM